ncbi:MAG: Fpg/Nei family DNA glycosylase [Acidimicrobiales bacterium]|nr:Fpg/Nei family DNA glycosylase [Acidimicrobiales bacterium]
MANTIQDRFAGQRVERSVFRHPALATVSLDGLTLDSADARGKHLLVRFSDGRTLHAHMLMQGRVAYRPATNVPQWRRRFEINLPGGTITGIDVPKLEMVRTSHEARLLEYLGPDLCGNYDHELAVARLQTAGSRPLGGALLDQRLIAGFGNIYAVETPFICGITPYQPVDSIDDVDRVVAVGAALIRTNAALGPQRTTGQGRVRAEHWVLPSDRRRCLICGAALTRHPGSRSPWKRRVALCPVCQPMRERTSVDIDRVGSLLATHPARKILDLAGPELLVDTDQAVKSTR